MAAMWVQGEEEETQQKPVWLQEDGQEVGSPTAANAGQLHLEGPTPTQPMDPQGAADFIGLDDDTPGEAPRTHSLCSYIKCYQGYIKVTICYKANGMKCQWSVHQTLPR